MDNPIVYSRMGRSCYLSQTRNEGNYMFSMKDLQKVLDNSLQQTSKNPAWKWTFMNSKEKIIPYYTPRDNDDTTLVFESRFECGNLNLAIKRSETEYDLILQNDSLTNGNTQWFYFKISNTRRDMNVTFHIINFVIYVYNLVKTRFFIQ